MIWCSMRLWPLRLAFLACMVSLGPQPLRAGDVLNSADALEAALDAAAPGDELRLAPGEYGALILERAYGDKANPVTLRSDDPADPARFSQLTARETQGVVLVDLVFDYVFQPGDSPEKLRVSQISQSADIIIRNSLFEGDLAREIRPTADGFGAGQGLVLRGAKGITIENCEFRNWYRGLVITRSSEIVLRGNNVHLIRSDGVDFAAVTQLLVENNHFHDFARAPAAGDHADMIQFWTNGTKTPTVDVTIRDNIFNSGHGLYTQSIFIRNEEVDTKRQGREMYYRNLVITGNVIVNAHLHGITVGETDGLMIANNTLIRNRLSDGPGGSDGLWTPAIRVSPAAENVTITRNITPNITGPEKHAKRAGAAASWRVMDNLLIQDRDPDAQGYYDAVFVAARSGDPATLAPFTYLPGGPAGQGTFGAARLLSSETGEGGVRALIRSAQDDRFVNRFSFDAGMSQLAPGAEAVWDFGDGTTARGSMVTHDFTTPGQFRVSLVVGEGGGPAEAAVTVSIPDPEVLRFEAQNGTVLARQDGKMVPLADMPLQPQSDGSALLSFGQGKDPVTIGAGAISGLFGARDLAIDLRLRSASTDTPAGEILRVHNSLIVSMTAVGGVEFWLKTADVKKPVAIRTPPLHLHDGRWHDIALRYDAASRRMAILVDGVERSRGRTSGPLRGGENRGLNLGNPFGKKSFDGQMSALIIRSNAASFAGP